MTHYVPILKGKQGELDALRTAAAEVRQGCTPLLEVPPIPLRYIEGQEEPVLAKSIDEHSQDVHQKIAAAWGSDARVFIDGSLLEEEDQLANGSEPIASILEGLRAAGVQAVPVTGLDRVQEYQLAVREAIRVDGRGCSLRLTESDLEGLAELEPQVKSLLDLLALPSESIDLLLDFGPRVPSRAAIAFQIGAIPFLDGWRSFTLASSAFPQNLAGMRQNSVEAFDREEWGLWTFLRSRERSVRRMPDFGDYAINHPALFEMDPRMMRPSPNIRYTGTLVFVVAKGMAYRRKKDTTSPPVPPPDQQYPELSRQIMNHHEWKGADFSWGDHFIAECAAGKRVGNPTSWRAVGTSHHLAFAVHQLASLP